MPGIRTRLLVAGLRLQARLPALPPSSSLGQLVTLRDAFPVETYATVGRLSHALGTLTWTPDPFKGNLDIIKHPTFMQEAIARHPEQSGDCDDYAAYSCVALLKSGLAGAVRFCTATWVDEKKDTIESHAICVYRDTDAWRWSWIGNWNRCQPIECGSSEDGWLVQLEARAGCKVFIATSYPASIGAHDTMLLERGRYLRR